jgi:nuclear GTP-binding protein
VRLRHKIEKAAAAKHRKSRKLAKKDPTWRSRLKKDPGIPNLFPYKEKILQEIEEKKRLKEEEALRKREELKALKTNSKSVNAEDEEGEVEVDLQDAEVLYDSGSGSDAEEDSEMIDDSKNPMAALLASAKARAAEYEHQGGADLDAMDEDNEDEFDGFDDSTGYAATTAAKGDSSRRAFDKIFKQVVE